jgi:hypothetical protein
MMDDPKLPSSQSPSPVLAVFVVEVVVGDFGCGKVN